MEEKNSLFEKHRENTYFRWGMTAFLVIVACVVVARLVFQLPEVLAMLGRGLQVIAPVLYGLGIAYLLDPVVGRVQLALQPLLENRFPAKAGTLARVLGVIVALVLLVLILWALVAMVLPGLISSLTTIVGNFPSYYNTLNHWVTGFIDDNLADYTNTAMDTVYNYLTTWLTDNLLPRAQAIVVSLTTSVFSMAKALLNLVIGLIISVYLLMGKTRFLSQAKKLTYAALGQRRAGYVCNVCTFANQVFGSFIGGKILDSLIIGILCFIGLSLLKMPYTLLIAIIVGVTNIIPFFGPYLGAVPSALLLLVIDPIKCLTFIIFILILQQLDGNVIGPKILGDATGLSGFWVVVSILVFGSLWGVLGMILAVPTFAVIFQIVADVTNHVLARRGLSTDTREYQRWDYPPRPEAEHWQRKRKTKFYHRLGKRTREVPDTPPEAPADREDPDAPPEAPADREDPAP